MSTSGIPAALQEKNEQEFVEVTRRIQDALARIESDPKLKASQDVLAKLANCSRGTLNNRKWPLDQLRKIKDARKTPVKLAIDETAAIAKEESRIERYKQQLYDSREEVLLWKTRFDDATQQLAQAQDLTRVLQARLAATEQEIAPLRRASATNIVQISSKQPK
ncbi:MAG: hypothetical protein CVU33_02490 [Betaproteobacteria bacterium HGW-Betaproteobacteria-6]|mgnify:CR=1 FL=1|jgi:hypothetical protein|nr:MAG: hypothetical protein CVU33_02490 [Betaproteobacteria bacterium HGW-Betaproteobacteria-6]